MNDRIAKIARMSGPVAQNEKLPYRIELWDHDGRSLERVLARALNASLGRLLFKAAQKEHPDRRILLRRGTRTVADSAE
jgi:hypothetical protein